jgi:hypothetical protein
MAGFSEANAKIKALASVKALKPYLVGRKVYSFDLISGWSCPSADQCLSKVHKIDGRSKIKDGPNTLFRCFSASQEALLPNVYNKRMDNFKLARIAARCEFAVVDMLDEQLPADAGIVRIHVGGDFFNYKYFLGWLLMAIRNPTVLFYAYTKELPNWLKLIGKIPSNFVLTASRGGRHDHLIDQHNLREAKVVFSEDQAKTLGLEIDHDDSHAADVSKKHQSFALLIHGVQPAGSEASEALKKLKGKGSYSKKGKK